MVVAFLNMIDEMKKKVCWLGDPNVTLVSDDGQQLLCHQSVLGIYNENLRSLLGLNKMKEYVLIFQDINHLELVEYMLQMYLSFETKIQNINDNESINLHEMGERKSMVENSNNQDILLNQNSLIFNDEENNVDQLVMNVVTDKECTEQEQENFIPHAQNMVTEIESRKCGDEKNSFPKSVENGVPEMTQYTQAIQKQNETMEDNINTRKNDVQLKQNINSKTFEAESGNEGISKDSTRSDLTDTSNSEYSELKFAFLTSILRSPIVWGK